VLSKRKSLQLAGRVRGVTVPQSMEVLTMLYLRPSDAGAEVEGLVSVSVLSKG